MRWARAATPHQLSAKRWPACRSRRPATPVSAACGAPPTAPGTARRATPAMPPSRSLWTTRARSPRRAKPRADLVNLPAPLLTGRAFRLRRQTPPAYNGLHVHPALSACVVLRHAAGTVRPGSGLAGGGTAVEPAQCDRRGDPGGHGGTVGLADRALRPEVDRGPGRRGGRVGPSGSMLLRRSGAGDGLAVRAGPAALPAGAGLRAVPGRRRGHVGLRALSHRPVVAGRARAWRHHGHPLL